MFPVPVAARFYQRHYFRSLFLRENVSHRRILQKDGYFVCAEFFDSSALTPALKFSDPRLKFALIGEIRVKPRAFVVFVCFCKNSPHPCLSMSIRAQKSAHFHLFFHKNRIPSSLPHATSN